MKTNVRFIIVFALLIFSEYRLTAQSDSAYQKGVVYFKIKDTSGIVLPVYDSSFTGIYPHFQNLISYFQIKKIKRSFSFLNHYYFNKVYRVEFDNFHTSNRIIDSLEQFPFLQFAEFNIKYKPIIAVVDTIDRFIWHVKDTRLYKAFDSTQGDSNVVIAITDMPISQQLLDLKGKLVKNLGEIPNNGVDDDSNGFIDDFDGWDFASGGDKNPFWDFPTASNFVKTFFSHGTYVASIAAGKINNPNSTTGACPNCKILPITVLTHYASDTFHSLIRSEVNMGYEGIAYAVYRGAKIVNVSWGGPADSMDAVGARLLDLADSLGVAIIAGAGNDNNEGNLDSSKNRKFYPASYNNVINVGAHNRDRFKAKFSNYRPQSKVDIMAPGEDIIAGSLIDSNNYVSVSGTSISAPIVSGILGLLWSRYPSFELDSVRSRIFKSCDSIDYKNFELRNKLGAGAINAYYAIVGKQGRNPDFMTRKLEQSAFKDSVITFFAHKIPNSRYYWYWGDDSSSVTTVDTIVKIYTQKGIYTIRLIVEDTITGFIDSIVKLDWFAVTTNKFSQNDYFKSWCFGLNCNLNFEKKGYTTRNNVPQCTYNSTGVHRILGSDSFLMYFQRDSLFGNDFFRKIWHNKKGYLNGNVKLDSCTFRIGEKNPVGLFIPSVNVDSIILIMNGYNSVLNNHVIRCRTISKSGNFSGRFFGPKPPGSENSTNGLINCLNSLGVIPCRNDSGYWLLCNPESASNQIYIYKLSSTGDLNDFNYVNKITLPTSFYIREIVASPSDSEFIVQTDTAIYLYSIDADTIYSLDVNLKHRIGGDFTVGSCFSPSGKMLYLTELQSASRNLVQYDLNHLTLLSAKKNVSTSSHRDYFGLQIAPDSCIYVNNGSRGYLSKITFPNLVNTRNYSNECGYILVAKDINTNVPFISRRKSNQSGLYLPNVVFHNIPDDIKINFKYYDCDSGILSSNFPNRIYKKWLVNGQLYYGSAPKVAYQKGQLL